MTTTRWYPECTDTKNGISQRNCSFSIEWPILLNIHCKCWYISHPPLYFPLPAFRSSSCALLEKSTTAEIDTNSILACILSLWADEIAAEMNVKHSLDVRWISVRRRWKILCLLWRWQTLFSNSFSETMTKLSCIFVYVCMGWVCVCVCELMCGRGLLLVSWKFAAAPIKNAFQMHGNWIVYGIHM